MQVVLVKSVRKLGKVGEIVNVKTGFGRNYLIPQKIAIRATEENMKLIENKRHEYEAKDLQARKDAEVFNHTIAGTELIFVRQAAIDGKLFGSVSSKDISNQLFEKFNSKIEYSNILLEAPIKSSGVYKVEILLHADIHADVIVAVAKSEVEATDAIKNFKNKKDDKELTENSENNNYSKDSGDSSQDQDTISL